MKIRSPIIASGGGSLAGMTLSRNRGGLYLRGRSNPVNPSSGAQVEIRTYFGNLSTRWQSLTDAQREAWTTYAQNVTVKNSLGEDITLTGHQMYIRNNTARLLAGFNEVDDGPTEFSSDVLSPVSISADGPGDQFSVTFEETDDWVDEDDAGLLVYGSRQQAPTINYFKGPYRFAGVIEGDSVTAPTSPQVLDSIFELDGGNSVFCRVQSVRADGRVSPVQFIGPITITS